MGTLTDYQLCYWYAREIEKRQLHYRSLFTELHLDCMELPFSDIGSWSQFVTVVDFVSKAAATPDRETFDTILRQDQNPRAGLLNGEGERSLPAKLESEEQHLDELIAAFDERERRAA